jgi:hypothetical protein
MIDITVHNDHVSVEMQNFYCYKKEEMVLMITEVVNKAKYSGESISLFVEVGGDMKEVVQRW